MEIRVTSHIREATPTHWVGRTIVKLRSLNNIGNLQINLNLNWAFQILKRVKWIWLEYTRKFLEKGRRQAKFDRLSSVLSIRDGR